MLKYFVKLLFIKCFLNEKSESFLLLLAKELYFGQNSVIIQENKQTLSLANTTPQLLYFFRQKWKQERRPLNTASCRITLTRTVCSVVGWRLRCFWDCFIWCLLCCMRFLSATKRMTRKILTKNYQVIYNLFHLTLVFSFYLHFAKK